MKRIALALLLLTSPASGQVPPPSPTPVPAPVVKPTPVASVKIPAGPLYAGDLITFDATASVGDLIDWEAISPPDITTYAIDSNGKGLAFANRNPGTYVFRLEAESVIDGKIVKSKQRIVFTTISPTPPPVPVPPPVPPVPVPVPPEPEPAPSPVGNMQVILLYESAQNITAAQRSVIFSTTSVVPYLEAHCLKGTDGRAGWRFWDKDTQVSATLPEWVDAMTKAKADPTPLPKLVVFAGNVVAGSKTLTTEADALSFLQSLGGK